MPEKLQPYDDRYCQHRERRMNRPAEKSIFRCQRSDASASASTGISH
jgi:hypothetical protein